VSLISLLIAVVLLGLFAYLLWWGIAAVGLPDPFNKVARVLVALIVLVLIVGLFTGHISVPVFRL
jgi:heme A synthase